MGTSGWAGAAKSGDARDKYCLQKERCRFQQKGPVPRGLFPQLFLAQQSLVNKRLCLTRLSGWFCLLKASCNSKPSRDECWLPCFGPRWHNYSKLSLSSCFEEAFAVAELDGREIAMVKGLQPTAPEASIDTKPSSLSGVKESIVAGTSSTACTTTANGSEGRREAETSGML